MGNLLIVPVYFLAVAMSTTIAHPLLGNVEGVVEGEVLQFRGIQYAMLEDRFASPVIRENYGGSIDARSFGLVALLVYAPKTTLMGITQAYCNLSTRELRHRPESGAAYLAKAKASGHLRCEGSQPCHQSSARDRHGYEATSRSLHSWWWAHRRQLVPTNRLQGHCRPLHASEQANHWREHQVRAAVTAL